MAQSDHTADNIHSKEKPNTIRYLQPKPIFCYISPFQLEQTQEFEQLSFDKSEFDPIPQNNQSSDIQLSERCQDSDSKNGEVDSLSKIYSSKSIQSSIFEAVKKHKNYMNDYVVEKIIGKGAFGRVERVREKKSNKIFAAKVILREYKDKGEEISKIKNERLVEEIKIYAKVYHPKIVELYSIYYWKEQYTLILQYMGEQNLKQYLNRRAIIPESTIASITFQILSALEYLHDLGIVHHDIKAENIMISEQNDGVSIWLVDFGEAIQLQNKAQEQRTRHFGGTVQYWPPEVVEGICSTKTDIWALGILVFLMVARKLPFQRNHFSQQLGFKIVSVKELVFQDSNWVGKSLEFKDFLRRCLRIQPNDRMTASSALEHEWFKKEGLVKQQPICEISHSQHSIIVPKRQKIYSRKVSLNVESEFESGKAEKKYSRFRQ